MIAITAEKLGLPKDVVKKVHRSVYKFIITKIREQPLDIYMTKDDVEALKTNFSIMDMGHLYCNWDTVQKRNRYLTYIAKRNLRKRRKKYDAEKTSMD